jgi:hypothetical protein
MQSSDYASVTWAVTVLRSRRAAGTIKHSGSLPYPVMCTSRGGEPGVAELSAKSALFPGAILTTAKQRCDPPAGQDCMITVPAVLLIIRRTLPAGLALCVDPAQPQRASAKAAMPTSTGAFVIAKM